MEYDFITIIKLMNILYSLQCAAAIVKLLKVFGEFLVTCPKIRNNKRNIEIMSVFA